MSVEIPIYVEVRVEENRYVVSLTAQASSTKRNMVAGVILAPDESHADHLGKISVMRYPGLTYNLDPCTAWIYAEHEEHGLAFRPACTEGVSE